MILIVDANILVSELLRQRGRQLIQLQSLELYIAERTLSETRHELRKRVTILENRQQISISDADLLLKLTERVINSRLYVVQESVYAHLELEAKKRIPRDPDDWHSVALALLLDAAIWTQDKDFLGCGCAT
jgi:predicted nucleic acid-binding protein